MQHHRPDVAGNTMQKDHDSNYRSFKKFALSSLEITYFHERAPILPFT